jgi:acetyltransferase (GNAT) family protein
MSARPANAIDARRRFPLCVRPTLVAPCSEEQDISLDELTAPAEGIEAEFMYQYVNSAPPAVKTRLGIATARIGGGVALSMRHDVTGYWSKALGFGFDEPVTEDVLANIVEFYRIQNSPGAVIQIAPGALPSNWEELRARYGITADSAWIKLTCPIEDFRPGRSELRVARVDQGTAAEWASVTMRGFGMPEEGLADMLAASAANPDFRPFAAWDGDEMVATANLFVRGETASLNSGATLPGHQNQGAHSALLAARAKEAADAGCRTLVAETGKPAEGAVNPSLNNMLRSGLQPLYARQNWLWRPAGPAAQQ